MNILFTSVAISQLKCLDYAFFVAKMSKMTFTRFGGQVWLNGGQVRQFWGRALARMVWGTYAVKIEVQMAFAQVGPEIKCPVVPV